LARIAGFSLHAATVGEVAAGVDTFVSGSAIFGSPDYRETISRMRAATRS